jgi:crotonobetainyl-CoA:carnitine CoA-transferase CaiB-like acyl-CoA transferase
MKLGQASVPCARIMRFEELMHHPQVTQNHYIEPAETKHWGKVYATGLPWTFSRTPATVLPTSDGGEQTGEILDELMQRQAAKEAEAAPAGVQAS